MNVWSIDELASMIKGCQYKLADNNLTDKDFDKWLKYMQELVRNYNGLKYLKKQLMLKLGM